MEISTADEIQQYDFRFRCHFLYYVMELSMFFFNLREENVSKSVSLLPKKEDF